jgi:hypothetical protein
MNSPAVMRRCSDGVPLRAALAMFKPEKAREIRLRVAAVIRTANVVP